MRTLFSLTIVVVSLSFATAQTNSELRGQVDGEKDKLIYFSRFNPSANRYVKDSMMLDANGRFVFKYNLAEPMMAFITTVKGFVADDNPNQTSIFLDPGTVTVSLQKDNFKKLNVTGSASQLQMQELSARFEDVNNRMKPFSDAVIAEKDKNKQSELRDKLEPFFAEFRKARFDFFEKYPQSPVTAFYLRFDVNELPVEKLEAYYAKLGPRVQQSFYGKSFYKEVEKMRAGSPGATAAVFKVQDIDGQTFNLSDFKGRKYVLLDFWASWCVPCRKGNPHLRNLYAKYKDKGLEIVGVSDDDGKPDAWKKAVETDSIGIWKHVLRGLDMKKREQGIANPEDISEMFGIHSLPTKILIDKNGVIIGRFDETEEALDKKLKEIFGI